MESPKPYLIKLNLVITEQAQDLEVKAIHIAERLSSGLLSFDKARRVEIELIKVGNLATELRAELVYQREK